MEKLNFDFDRISGLCNEHKVKSLYLFGSYAKGTPKPNSDVDFLVTFNNVDLYNYFDNYLNLKDELEKIVRKEVDLVEEQTLKNPFLIHSINQNKILLYGESVIIN